MPDFVSELLGQDTRDQLQKADDLKWIAITVHKIGNHSRAAEIFRQAFQAAGTIAVDESKLQTLTELAAAQSEAGDHIGAKLSIQHALGVRGVSVSYRNPRLALIPFAQAKMGDISGGLTTAASLGDTFWKYQALGGIARAQVEADDISGALKTLATIDQRSHVKAEGLANIADAQIKAGRQKEAKATLEDAVQAAGLITDDYYIGVTLARTARMQAEIGDQNTASATLREALSVALNIPAETTPSRDNVLELVTYAQVKLGKIDEAQQTATQIQDNKGWFKKSAVTGIACALAEKGDVKGALKTSEQIREGGHAKAEPIPCVAVAMVNGRGTTQALAMASDIKNESSKVYYLRTVAKAQATIGDVKGARAWASKETSPLLKSNALLGVAEGILERTKARKDKAKPER